MFGKNNVQQQQINVVLRVPPTKERRNWNLIRLHWSKSKNTNGTRMHSSRMRNVRCSLCPGDVYPGGYLPGGVSAQGRRVCLGGVCHGGGVSAQGGGVCPEEGGVCRVVSARHPPCEQNQTGVKTLLCRNYFANGKNRTSLQDRLNVIPHSIVQW